MRFRRRQQAIRIMPRLTEKDYGRPTGRVWSWVEIGAIFGLAVAGPPVAMWLLGLL